MIQYHLSQGTDGRKTLTVFDPSNGSYVFPNDHPSFDEALNLTSDADLDGYALDRLSDLADVAKVVEDRILNADVQVKDRRVVLSDGNVVGSVIERKILDAVTEDDADTYTSLAAFLASVSKNPSQRSREQLYSWLDKHGFEILANGTFLAWKGVAANLNSIHTGFALVNGREVNGHVPNQPGNTIEFPRERVDDDPNAACSTGLHVGSRSFAKGFGSVLLRVAVAPEDVVSVPADSDEQKVRVCRYEVLDREYDAYDSDSRTWS